MSARCSKRNSEPKWLHPQRELLGLEEPVERGGELGGARVEPLLEAGAVSLEVGQHGAGGDHRHRVLDVGAAEERGVGGRVAVVAVRPEAAVDAVHDVGAAGDRADGEAAAEQLAVGGEVRCDAEQLLRAAQGGAEAGQHLVEQQHDAVPAGQLPQPAYELDRLQLGVPALHRLHDDRGDVVGVPRDGLQGGVAAVVEHQQVGDGGLRDASGDGHGELVGAGAGSAAEDVVGVAVVGALERDDLVAAGGGAGQPDRRGVRLRTGVGEGHPLQAGQFGEQLGGLAGLHGARAELHAAGQVLADGLGDEVRLVAEEQDAEAHRDVDVLVAVDVLQPCPARPVAGDRVQHLLGAAAEADDGTAVGEDATVALRDPLGGRGPGGVAAYEVGQVLLLRVRRDVLHHAGTSRDRHPGAVDARCLRGRGGGPAHLLGDALREFGHRRQVLIQGGGYTVQPGHWATLPLSRSVTVAVWRASNWESWDIIWSCICDICWILWARSSSSSRVAYSGPVRTPVPVPCGRRCRRGCGRWCRCGCGRWAARVRAPVPALVPVRVRVPVRALVPVRVRVRALVPQFWRDRIRQLRPLHRRFGRCCPRRRARYRGRR